MTHGQVSVEIFEEFNSDLSEDWLRKVAEKALTLHALDHPGDVGLVIADDDTVRDLNKRYRGLDENTDVLSFSPSHRGEYYGPDKPLSSSDDDITFVLPPGQETPLGEIIISYPQTTRQAAEAGHSAEREMALLIAHGLLHLLGHDHVKDEEEALMKEKEAQVLAELQL